MAWVVGRSVPGQMPDPEVPPVPVGTWGEASNVLMVMLGEVAMAPDAPPLTDYRDASATLQIARLNEPLAFFYAGYVWWLIESTG